MSAFRLRDVRLWQMGLWLTVAVVLLAGSLPGIAQTQQDDPPLQRPLLALNTVERDSLLLYDVTDNRLRRLSAGAGDHFVWDFSPDGCRVLFTLWQGTEPGRLLSMNLRGGDVREMVRFTGLPPEQWGIWEPDWSPDGERIAFTMIRERFADGEPFQEHHIGWVTPDNPEPQFYSVTGREHSPQWSPDGAWLAYVSYDERVAGAGTFATAAPTPEPAPDATAVPPLLLYEADMWLVSANSDTKYRLTNFQTGSVSQPRWSPDGDLMAFVYSPTPNNDMVWMIGAQQGANPTQLTNEWALVLDTTWLPDSTHILSAIRDFRDVNPNTLWQIPLVGLADETGTQYLTEYDIRHMDYPRFSADGNWLALRSAYAAVLVNLTDESARRLPDSTLDNSPPVWSPPGFQTETDCE